MRPLRASALGGVLLLLQLGVLLAVLGIGAVLPWVLPSGLEPHLQWLGWRVPIDVLQVRLGELLAGGAALWLSAALPVLGIRWLLPEEVRGPRRTIHFLAAAWTVVLLVVWMINRFWMDSWEQALVNAAFQGTWWRSQDSDRYTPLSGVLILCGLFLGWSAGWALHLSRTLPEGEASALLRRVRLWGLRSVLGALLLALAVWPLQVWWARDCARVEVADLVKAYQGVPARRRNAELERRGLLLGPWEAWSRILPWGGIHQDWNSRIARVRWWPRRAYGEYLRLVTGQDLPNDPEAWKAWLDAHPDLVWDPAQGRFVEKTVPGP